MVATKIVKLDPRNPSDEQISEAAEVLKNGGLVIMPTETVYGIGANMLDKKAVQRLYEIKKRPKDKPFSLHIDNKDKVALFAKDAPVCAYKLMDAFWPGPLTLVFLARDKGTIGLRLPSHPVALRLIREARVPVVCPSANISGKKPPVDFSEAIADLNGLVEFAIDAGRAALGLESTVVDVTAALPVVLREGAIKQAQIEAVLNKKNVLFVCTGNSCRSVMAKAMLEKRLRESGRSDVQVFSAGLSAVDGFSATDETQELLRSEGVDVSGHRSHSVTREMIKRSDIILVMERVHEERLLQLAPEAKNRLSLLKEFAKIDNNILDIPDPIGRSPEFYQETLQIIKEAIERVVRII